MMDGGEASRSRGSPCRLLLCPLPPSSLDLWESMRRLGWQHAEPLGQGKIKKGPYFASIHTGSRSGNTEGHHRLILTSSGCSRLARVGRLEGMSCRIVEALHRMLYWACALAPLLCFASRLAAGRPEAGGVETALQRR